MGFDRLAGLGIFCNRTRQLLTASFNRRQEKLQPSVRSKAGAVPVSELSALVSDLISAEAGASPDLPGGAGKGEGSEAEAGMAAVVPPQGKRENLGLRVNFKQP